MTDRTEELGLSGLIPISVGGSAVRLRVLAIGDSEDWQAQMGKQIEGVNVPVGGTLAEVFAALSSIGSAAQIDALLAYDTACGKRAGVLSRETMRSQMTQRELYSAVKEVVKAEFPLATDLRSAAEVFGPQIRLLLAVVMERLSKRNERSSSEPDSSGSSPTGDATPATSESDSPSSSS